MSSSMQFLSIVVCSTTAFCLFAIFVRNLWRKTKSRPPRVSGVLWAMMFMSSSDVPPPTPQEQVEQENREKKNRGAKDRD